MKKTIAFLACFISFGAFASIVILFNPLTGRDLVRVDSANTLEYIGKSNALVNPDVPTNNLAVCKVTNGAVVLLNSQELLADWLAVSNANRQSAIAERAEMVATASAYIHGTNAEGRILKAFALLTLDQINTLRKLHSLAVISTNTFLNAMSNAVINDPR